MIFHHSKRTKTGDAFTYFQTQHIERLRRHRFLSYELAICLPRNFYQLIGYGSFRSNKSKFFGFHGKSNSECFIIIWKSIPGKGLTCSQNNTHARRYRILSWKLASDDDKIFHSRKETGIFRALNVFHYDRRVELFIT